MTINIKLSSGKVIELTDEEMDEVFGVRAAARIIHVGHLYPEPWYWQYNPPRVWECPVSTCRSTCSSRS